MSLNAPWVVKTANRTLVTSAGWLPSLDPPKRSLCRLKIFTGSIDLTREQLVTYFHLHSTSNPTSYTRSRPFRNSPDSHSNQRSWENIRRENRFSRKSKKGPAISPTRAKTPSRPRPPKYHQTP